MDRQYLPRLIAELWVIESILNFLGYTPIPPAQTLPDRLVSMRKILGLSQRKMAARRARQPGTLQGWEAGQHEPSGKSLELIANALREG
jgi:predicted transcriptional regulator